MRHPVIVAFMQNPWFPPGTKKEVVDRYLSDQDFHRRLLARTMSGRRLLDAFGPDMFGRIHWDNVAPTAAEEANGKTDVDAEHIERVLNRVKPDLIICFGKLAEWAITNSFEGDGKKYLLCHHPNARGKTSADMAEFVIRVAEWCDLWRIQS